MLAVVVLLLLLHVLLLLLLLLHGDATVGHDGHAVGHVGGVGNVFGGFLVQAIELVGETLGFLGAADEAGASGAAGGGRGGQVGVGPGGVPHGGRGEVGALAHGGDLGAATAHGVEGLVGGPHGAVALGAVGPVAVPSQAGVVLRVGAQLLRVAGGGHVGLDAAVAAAQAHLLDGPVDVADVVAEVVGVVLQLEAVGDAAVLVGGHGGRGVHVVVGGHANRGSHSHLENEKTFKNHILFSINIQIFSGKLISTRRGWG